MPAVTAAPPRDEAGGGVADGGQDGVLLDQPHGFPDEGGEVA
jgi:hypothetical protein